MPKKYFLQKKKLKLRFKNKKKCLNKIFFTKQKKLKLRFWKQKIGFSDFQIFSKKSDFQIFQKKSFRISNFDQKKNQILNLKKIPIFSDFSKYFEIFHII